MSEQEQPLCDVCGKPATNFARDEVARTDPSTPFTKFSPDATIKKGCNEHPARSERIEIETLPFGWGK